MARLYLKFEQAVLKEVALTEGSVTVGRLPDNTVQIDNLAVSGHHCKIYWDTDHYVVEDNNSLNGTYVNNQRVNKGTLKDGDEILIGKHVLNYREAAITEAPKNANEKTVPSMQGMESTMVFTGKAVKNALDQSATATGQAAVPARERTGVLNVMDGKTDEKSYVLSSKLTVIGKSDMASIKLKGWFAPKVAANVMRREQKYIIAASEKDIKVKINGEEVAGQHELNEGDMIEVAGIKFQFGYQE